MGYNENYAFSRHEIGYTLLSLTNKHCDTSWCAIPSTVAGDHTNIVLLAVEHRNLDGGVGGDEERT